MNLFYLTKIDLPLCPAALPLGMPLGLPLGLPLFAADYRALTVPDGP